VAVSRNELTRTLAVGVFKTTILNGTPLNFGVQYWHYVKKLTRSGRISRFDSP
jgi:hypothetical protein